MVMTNFRALVSPWDIAILSICLVSLYQLRRYVSKQSHLSTDKPKRGETTTQASATSIDEKDWETLEFSGIQPISEDFEWQKADVRPYRPWHDGPHYVTMGLQKTEICDWVEIDKEYLSRYEYKRQLLSKHHNDIVQYEPGSEEASFEALYYLVDFLPRRYPSMFKKTDKGIDNLVTGDKWDLRRDSEIWKSWHPMQLMGLLSTEDWFIMQTDDDGETTRLRAGASCFPAGWKIRERIGRSLWQIHAGKVPYYEQKLSKSMDRFFVRLRADKPIMRFNYAIDLSGELFHIHSHHNLTQETLEKPLTVDQLHLRVERQFLQRLPKTKAIVFSIRTYVTPILEVTKDEDVARALRTSVRSYSSQVAKYKNKHLWNDVMEAHFAEILPETNLPGQDSL